MNRRQLLALGALAAVVPKDLVAAPVPEVERYMRVARTVRLEYTDGGRWRIVEST